MPTEELVLSDTHAHLESYEPKALEELINRANANGIRIIVANGITLRSSSKSVEIAGCYPCVWATVGLHPYYADRLRNAVGSIRELALRERVVGIGEIGLDFSRHPETRELQLPLFDEQLRLARELDLPVVIHANKLSHQETLGAIRRNGIQEGRGIMQGFRGDLAALGDWLKLGFYLSVGPTILREPSEGLVEVIQKIPSERLLLETDARAGRTLSQGLELATLKPIAEKVAEIRNVPVEDIGRVTTNNLMKIFRLTERQYQINE